MTHAQIPGFNITNPYDWEVSPPVRKKTSWDLTVGFEDNFKARSYQADEDARGRTNIFRKRADVLQLWQDKQDFLAALQGEDFDSQRGQLLTQFNINGNDGTHGLFIPRADLDVKNIMLSTRWYLPYNVNLAFYVPVRSIKLKNIEWNKAPENTHETFDSTLINDFVSQVENLAGINLSSAWHKKGVGDIACRATWASNFPQMRALIRNVHLEMHIGATIPTGEHADPDMLFGLPLGHDAGAGIFGGGHIGVRFGKYCTFGVDTQLHHLFGESRRRRIKTSADQTDLLFLSDEYSFKEPGFRQHFTVYSELANFGLKGLSLRCAYIHSKQHESILFLKNHRYDAEIANTAESLEEWTTHSIMGSFSYDMDPDEKWSLHPYLHVYLKHGFNGQRAVLSDVVGGILSIDF